MNNHRISQITNQTKRITRFEDRCKEISQNSAREERQKIRQILRDTEERRNSLLSVCRVSERESSMTSGEVVSAE